MRRIVGVVFLIIAIFGVSGAAAAVSTYVGATRITSIQTEAMSPALKSGALTISVPVPTSSLKVGDIISVRTVEDNNADTLGRIETIEEDGDFYAFTLKSDANVLADEWIYKSSTTSYKMIFFTPYAGDVVQFFKTIPGIVALLIFVGLLAWIYIYALHGPVTLTQRILNEDRRTERIREYSSNFGGVDELKAWFASAPLTPKRKRRRNKNVEENI